MKPDPEFIHKQDGGLLPMDPAFGGSGDQGKGIRSDGLVAGAGFIELGENEGLNVLSDKFRADDGVGDAAFDVVVGGKPDGGKEFGLADEDEVVEEWMTPITRILRLRGLTVPVIPQLPAGRL